MLAAGYLFLRWGDTGAYSADDRLGGGPISTASRVTYHINRLGRKLFCAQMRLVPVNREPSRAESFKYFTIFFSDLDASRLFDTAVCTQLARAACDYSGG